MLELLNYTQGPAGDRFDRAQCGERGSRWQLSLLLCVCIIWTEDISSESTVHPVQRVCETVFDFSQRLTASFTAATLDPGDLMISLDLK